MFSQALGGEILGYAGLFLCLWTIHGAFRIRCNTPTVLFLIAVALNIIGMLSSLLSCLLQAHLLGLSASAQVLSFCGT